MKISHENRVKVLKTLIRLFLFQSNIFVPINMFLLANCCQGLLWESIMRFFGNGHANWKRSFHRWWDNRKHANFSIFFLKSYHLHWECRIDSKSPKKWLESRINTLPLALLFDYVDSFMFRQTFLLKNWVISSYFVLTILDCSHLLFLPSPGASIISKTIIWIIYIASLHCLPWEQPH